MLLTKRTNSNSLLEKVDYTKLEKNVQNSNQKM